MKCTKIEILKGNRIINSINIQHGSKLSICKHNISTYIYEHVNEYTHIVYMSDNLELSYKLIYKNERNNN